MTISGLITSGLTFISSPAVITLVTGVVLLGAIVYAFYHVISSIFDKKNENNKGEEPIKEDKDADQKVDATKVDTNKKADATIVSVVYAYTFGLVLNLALYIYDTLYSLVSADKGDASRKTPVDPNRAAPVTGEGEYSSTEEKSIQTPPADDSSPEHENQNSQMLGKKPGKSL